MGFRELSKDWRGEIRRGFSKLYGASGGGLDNGALQPETESSWVRNESHRVANTYLYVYVWSHLLLLLFILLLRSFYFLVFLVYFCSLRTLRRRTETLAAGSADLDQGGAEEYKLLCGMYQRVYCHVGVQVLFVLGTKLGRGSVTYANNPT